MEEQEKSIKREVIIAQVKKLNHEQLLQVKEFLDKLEQAAPQKEYSYHLTFADGSNPYVSFPADEKTHKAGIRKWKRNYVLDLLKRTESPAGIVTEWYTATEKRNPINLFTD